MKKGWQTKSFEDCIESVKYTRKIQRKDFLDEGQFPIVSQEAEFTNGYWDDEADVFKVSSPVVIFGDHTQVLKYVDFDFVLGADGVKILPPRNFLRPKFFFYQLQAANFTSLGYARHYRLLKDLEINYPPSPSSSASSASSMPRLRASPPPKPTPKRTSTTPAPSSTATSKPSSPSAARGGWRRPWVRPVKCISRKPSERKTSYQTDPTLFSARMESSDATTSSTMRSHSFWLLAGGRHAGL